MEQLYTPHFFFFVNVNQRMSFHLSQTLWHQSYIILCLTHQHSAPVALCAHESGLYASVLLIFLLVWEGFSCLLFNTWQVDEAFALSNVDTPPPPPPKDLGLLLPFTELLNDGQGVQLSQISSFFLKMFC